MTSPKHPQFSGPRIDKAYTWEKDLHGRYLRCNELYAEAAGLDSPDSILGKTDAEMPWRELAELFRKGDLLVIHGSGKERMFAQEKEIMVDRIADILVTEGKLLNQFGECIGVTGSFIDITGYTFVEKCQTRFDRDTKKLWLPEDVFGSTYLTPAEVRVLDGVCQGMTAPQIAERDHTSKRTVEKQIDTIKQKLQCKRKEDLIATSQRHGLPFTLHEVIQMLYPTNTKD